MSSYLNHLNNAKQVKFEKHHELNDSHFGQCKDVTTIYGYDNNSQLSFFASYDKDNNYRVTFYQGDHEPRLQETFYSDMDDAIALLPKGEQEKHHDAKLFIQKLQTLEKQQTNSSHSQSLAESLKDGVNLNLSQESRLSFAPNIEKLSISKDKDGVLHITGASNDGKQSVNFSKRDDIISFEFTDGEIGRSYNNKFRGSWTYRDTNSTNNTRYLDVNGEKYVREFASIMDKLKVAYQQRSNTQQKTGMSYSQLNNKVH